jgi:hypothetical protein
MRKAVVAAGSALVLISGLVAGVAPVGAGVATAAGSTVQPFDFDGDGYADLAVGVPGEDLRGRRNAGAVQVLYGSASGVTARDQLWHQGRKGVQDALEKGDRFGSALASGDFDADGYADLAIGVPGEGLRGRGGAGAVQVLYGSSRGLTARDQVWHQGKPGVPGSNERGDGFGSALAAGDFDADGYADLVIGSPFEDVGSLIDAGWAVVLRGGPRGLTAKGALSLRQGLGGIPSSPATGEQFGVDLAVGDVNSDGRDDLAIAVRLEADSPPDAQSPAVHLLWGSPGGLSATGVQYFLTSDLGTPWLNSSTGAWHSMAFADFNSDGYSDLALAAESSAAVLHGHADGLHPAVLPEASAATPGADAVWRGIGSGGEDPDAVLAAGDVTGDGYPDLVGHSGESAVAVISGTAGGLSSVARRWPLSGEGWYYVLEFAMVPLSGGTHAWLAVWQETGEAYSPGAVAVLRGTPAGTPGPVTRWTQDSPGVKGVAEHDDFFGRAIGG